LSTRFAKHAMKSVMDTPTKEQATAHLARAMDELGRLKEHFQQRPKDEKKRLGGLERLIPKLRRLAKTDSVAGQSPSPDRLSAEDKKLLESLAPKASGAA
jgi:ribosomal protein S15P/S13E